MTELERDSELMTRIASGDAGAFRQLSSLYLKTVVTFSTRLLKSAAEGEEIAQETFLRAWQKADSYEPKARAVTWLLRIARNLCIDRMRSRAVRPEDFALDDERDAAPTSTAPAALAERKSQAERVRAALDLLPERQKEAILLSHEQGLSNPEIGNVLDVGVEAVESLLARGRRRLRELLESEALSS